MEVHTEPSSLDRWDEIQETYTRRRKKLEEFLKDEGEDLDPVHFSRLEAFREYEIAHEDGDAAEIAVQTLLAAVVANKNTVHLWNALKEIRSEQASLARSLRETRMVAWALAVFAAVLAAKEFI